MEIPSEKAILIFDGICNFCNGSVNFVMSRDRRGRFLFTSNQSEAGAALLNKFDVDPGAVQSVFLVEGNKIWSKSDAAIQIAKRMPFPWNLGYLGGVVPRFLRDRVYDWIAKNRYRWFGKAGTCRLPTEAERAKFL